MTRVLRIYIVREKIGGEKDGEGGSDEREEKERWQKEVHVTYL